jgi:hypothetical protein
MTSTVTDEGANVVLVVVVATVVVVVAGGTVDDEVAGAVVVVERAAAVLVGELVIRARTKIATTAATARTSKARAG